MKKAIGTICIFSLLFILFLGVAGCSKSPASSTQTSTDNDSTVQAYADPATETTLLGLSENSLTKYTQYGNPEFKAALTQENFDKTATQINSQLGTYQTKEFLSTETEQGYVIVHYKVKYTQGEVGVRMVFDKNHLVAGQWFE